MEILILTTVRINGYKKIGINNALERHKMGRVFIEEAMNRTGIDRTDLVIICTYLVRSKQARSSIDAIRRLEQGDFDGVDLYEEMVKAHQTVKEEVVAEDVDDTTEEW